jgi:monovalent cation:H+ antiporter-2, CPA2 family
MRAAAADLKATSMQSLFLQTLIILGMALAMAALSSRLAMPTLLGYLVGGILLGPSILGLIQPGEAMRFLAELGVVLLMFMVGLEFSVKELRAKRRQVFVAGALQMLLTGTAMAVLAFFFGASLKEAALLSGAAAMSSTAITARQLSEQGKLNSRYGRMTIAVLVFQDIVLVPLLTLFSIWSRGGNAGWMIVLMEVAGTLALFAFAAIISRPVFHSVLAWIARHTAAEVFLLAALVLVTATAFGAHEAGLSPVLGAFLAGLVLGESDFRHRIEDDLRPFRDVLQGLFFITVGMQANFDEFLLSPLPGLIWLTMLLGGKMLLAWPAMRVAGLGSRDAWRAAIILGHGGESSLLVIAGALTAGVLSHEIGQPVLNAVVLSMAMAPILISGHDRLLDFAAKVAGLSAPAAGGEETISYPMRAERHVVIFGAGKLGRLVAHTLSSADVPYLLVDSDYSRYQEALAAGLNMLHGDINRSITLDAAAVARASMVVIAFEREEATLRLLRVLHREAPDVTVIATSRDEKSAQRLRQAAGWTIVFPESLAAGLALAEQALLVYGLDAEDVDAILARQRTGVAIWAIDDKKQGMPQ